MNGNVTTENRKDFSVKIEPNITQNDTDRFSSVICTVAGVALGVASVLSFCTSGSLLIQIVPWLGGGMLLSGICNIMLYYRECHKGKRNRWVLADGLTAVLLSLFLLFNQMVSPATIPFFFCVWELFSGAIRLIESIERKESDLRGWQWFFTVGAIEILSGVAALLKPVEEALTMHVVVGIVLLIQAIAFWHKAFVVPKLQYRTKR